MNKRPLCTAALIWAAVLWLLGQAGVPFLGYAVPVLPSGTDFRNASVTGIIYKKDSYTLHTNLYLNHTNLILNSKKYPIASVKVTMKNEKLKEEIPAGSRIAVQGELKPVPLPANPGQFHERAYYYARKIKWYQEWTEIRVLQREENKFTVFRERIKAGLREGIRASFPEKAAGIQEAMLLGEKEYIGQENAFLFQIMGCSHMLAVSGLHLSVLGGGGCKILRKLRIPSWAAGIMTAAAMFFYGALTGNGASVLRAAVMFAAAQGAAAAKRTYDVLSAMALSAILLLAESPMYLYDSSFLLSFGAVLGLGLVYPVLFPKDSSIRHSSIRAKLRQQAADGLRSGISVWCVLLPPVMYFFFELPLWGIFISPVVLPAAGIIFVSGILGGILGLLPVRILGQAAAVPGLLFLQGYLEIGEIVRKLPYALWITGQPKLWQCGVYYLLLTLALWEKSRKKKCRVHPAVLLVSAAALLFWKPQDGDVKLTFLDVGQGDCACIQNQSRRCYLVDGGSSSVSKVGKYRILPFLKASGIREIEGVFISHMDEDHVNGILELLEFIRNRETAVRIRRLFLSECPETQEQRVRMETAGKQAGCELVYIKAGTRITDKGMMIECLAPSRALMKSNEASQVLRLTYGEFDALFTGDLEGQGERAFLALEEKDGRDYEILKTAHHGSKNATGEEFLKKIHPFAAVISCGRDNRYGHPHRELLDRLEAEKIKVFQTPKSGAVFVSAGKDRFEISCCVPFQAQKIMVK